MLSDRFAYKGRNVMCLRYAPDSSSLALCPGDGTVWVQRVPDGDVLLHLGGHKGKIKRVAFSQDGKLLASGGEDGLIILWQLERELENSLKATYRFTLQHEDWVTGLVFSPDGETLVSSSIDGALHFWDVASGEHLGALARSGTLILSLAISPDGQYLAAGTQGGEVLMWHKEEE